MQSKEKIIEDSRTFPEIWASMTTAQRDHLRRDLKDRLKVTRAAVWYWYNGQRRPDYLRRKEIARLTSNVIGRKCHPDLLFP